MDLLQDKKKSKIRKGIAELDDTSPGPKSCMGIRNATNHSSGSDQSKGSALRSLFAAVLAGTDGRSIHLLLHLLLILRRIFIIQIR